MIDAKLLPVLEELRAPLQVDGADLELEDFVNGVARIRLVLASETCAECIMPRPILEKIMLMAFSKHDVPLTRVELIDPREE